MKQFSVGFSKELIEASQLLFLVNDTDSDLVTCGLALPANSSDDVKPRCGRHGLFLRAQQVEWLDSCTEIFTNYYLLLRMKIQSWGFS